MISGVGRNIVAPHAYMQLEVRGESTEINDYMAANVEMTVKGMAAAYGVQYRLTRMGEAVTYKGDEEAVEAVKQAARTVEGVDSVVDMNAKVGSEDCLFVEFNSTAVRQSFSTTVVTIRDTTGGISVFRMKYPCPSVGECLRDSLKVETANVT